MKNLFILFLTAILVLSCAKKNNIVTPTPMTYGIYYIQPDTVKEYDEISIHGIGFGEYRSTFNVFIDSLQSPVINYWDDTLIVARAPYGFKSGKLYVRANDINSNTVNVYLAVEPIIDTIFPTPLKLNDIMNIKGKGFGALRKQSIVSFFGSVGVDYIEWSDSLIKVRVPDDATPGNLWVAATGYISNSKPYYILYDSIVIGKQIWMKYNLNVSRYRNGDSIPHVPNINNWVNMSTGAWVYYNNDESLGKIYGKLYNWYGAQRLNLPPMGWRVPNDTDWAVLEKYLGGENIAGGKLKETGFAHWLSPNTGATNETGFYGLPGGIRVAGDTNFVFLGQVGKWWTTYEAYNEHGLNRSMVYDSAILSTGMNLKYFGFSVRCIK